MLNEIETAILTRIREAYAKEAQRFADDNIAACDFPEDGGVITREEARQLIRDSFTAGAAVASLSPKHLTEGNRN
jgi:hypothetical protein